MDILRSSIPLLEKFGITSIILSYFGQTHKGYLILSQLSPKSRAMLNSFYEGIMNSLFKFNQVIDISESNLNSLFLPSDFFNLFIHLNNEKTCSVFLSFINKILEKKGHYFNERFLHERLCIRSIYVDVCLIDELYPYVESFKSIKLLNYDLRNEDIHTNKISTLFDILLFHNEDSFIVDETKFLLPKLKKVPIEQTNNTSDLIQNISFLSLEYFEFDQCISILDDFGKTSLYIYYIMLSGNSSEELESLFNPNYYSNGVNTLSYSFKTSHDISDKALENINKINPSYLIFTVKIGVNMSYDYIKLLSKITNTESIQIMYKYALNSCSLQFSNVPIKITQSNYEDPLYLMCEEFDCKIEVNEYNQNFWFNYCESNDKLNKFCFIHIKYTKDCSFKNYKVISKEDEIKSIFKDYPPDLNIHDNGLEIIVPMHFLANTNINPGHNNRIMMNEESKMFINELSRAKSFSCSISYFTEIDQLCKCTSLYPLNCKYSLSEYSISNKVISSLNTNLSIPNILKYFSNCNLCTIYINFELSSEEFAIFKSILSVPKVQINLISIKLILKFRSQALEILDLVCKNCINVGRLDLRWSEGSAEKVECKDRIWSKFEVSKK